MYMSFLIGGINIIALVFGLTEALKKAGVKGFWLTLSSLILGVLFGFAFRLVSVGMPDDIAGWISTVVTGLAIGLTTSGIYDFFDGRFPVKS